MTAITQHGIIEFAFENPRELETSARYGTTKNELSSSAEVGTPATVLLNFFGDTCAPCRVESPWLVQIQQDNRAKGLEIIGVEMYGASNDAVNKYRKDFGTNYTVVHGTDAVADQYGAEEFPTSYFINRDGIVVASTVGLHSKQDLDDDVAAVLQSN